jgi:hypothetical protein
LAALAALAAPSAITAAPTDPAPTGTAFDYDGWTPYSTASEPAAGGVAVTVMVPASFAAAPRTAPGVLKEFLRPDPSGGGASYLSVTVASEGLVPGVENRPTRLFRGRNGEWDQLILESFWKGLSDAIPGVSASRTFFFKGYPAADLSVSQAVRSGDRPARLELDLRLALYGDALIKLECGDLSEDPSKAHERTLEEVCRPFFDSLAFGDG